MSQPSLLGFMLLYYYDFGCVVSCLDEVDACLGGWISQRAVAADIAAEALHVVGVIDNYIMTGRLKTSMSKMIVSSALIFLLQ